VEWEEIHRRKYGLYQKNKCNLELKKEFPSSGKCISELSVVFGWWYNESTSILPKVLEL
jgi:hypothetical protein